MNDLNRMSKLATLAVILVALAASPSLSDGAESKGLQKKESKAKALAKPAQNKRETKPGKSGRNLISATGQKKRLPENKSDALRREGRRQLTPRKTTQQKTAQSSVPKRQRNEELRRAEEVRRLEAARTADVARARARDESLRDGVQAMIAKDDLSGEDPEIRRVAINALGNHAGTVVVMDPKTGRIHSIVNQQWAVREGFKPCSTIKLVTGLAGLNEQVIEPGETIRTSGSSNESLTRALAYSRNDYFQQVGGQVGFDKMLSYARQLGLGEKTGINMRNEFPGSIPSSKARPGIARMSSHGDKFEVTALQLATLVSAISNGGKLVTPYVVRSRQDELKFRTRVRRHIRLETETWRSMIPGMVGAVNYGSGKRAYDPRHTVAGKTGTCIEREGWVGLFTSYAPLSNPRLAVVVIARGLDAHSHFPAAVAGRIYRDLNHRLETRANPQIATARRSYVPEMTVVDNEEKSQTTTVSQLSNRDRNGTKNRIPLIGSKDTTASVKVKPVLMQIPKRIESPVLPVESNDGVPAVTDGQTRPRRVYGR